jgi:hypothetical protein
MVCHLLPLSTAITIKKMPSNAGQPSICEFCMEDSRQIDRSGPPFCCQTSGVMARRNGTTFHRSLIVCRTAEKTIAAYFLAIISTRRFFCLPSGSSEPSGLVFETAGFLAPKPAVEKRTFFSPSL